MKNILLLIVLLFISKINFSQDLKFGIEIAPSYKIQLVKNNSTGLYTNVNGYGFNLGLPLKIEFNDKYLTTGIIYEFNAFDNKVNNFLVSSNRFHSIDIPLIYNYPIIDYINFDFGGGISYIFSSREYGLGVWVSKYSSTNKLQPYFAVGGSTTLSQNENIEIAIHGKIHPFNLWTFSGPISNRLIALDLNLRYYF